MYLFASVSVSVSVPMPVPMPVSVSVSVSVSMSVSVGVSVLVCVHVCVCVCTCMCLCVCVRACPSKSSHVLNVYGFCCVFRISRSQQIHTVTFDIFFCYSVLPCFQKNNQRTLASIHS